MTGEENVKKLHFICQRHQWNEKQIFVTFKLTLKILRFHQRF